MSFTIISRHNNTTSQYGDDDKDNEYTTKSGSITIYSLLG